MDSFSPLKYDNRLHGIFHILRFVIFEIREYFKHLYNVRLMSVTLICDCELNTNVQQQSASRAMADIISTGRIE